MLGTIGAWLDDWVWGLLLITVSLVIHACGIAMIGLALARWFGVPAAAAGRNHYSPLRFPAAIAVVSLALAVLHGLEAVVWAIAYLWFGALNTFHDAIFFSLQMVTTLGATDLDLHPGWRLMGPLEGVAGMMVFGLSTAFLLAVFQRVSPFAPPAGDE